MALEVGDFIDDLDETYPLGSDSISQGDDHIRLIKHILKTQFPNLDEAVTSTAKELNQGGTPTGSMLMHAGSTAPTGYVICNGAALSRTTYADLYTAIGVVYGNGNGSTTFNVPDMRDSTTGGVSVDNALGSNAGKDLWTDADLPAHTHAVTGGAHTHTVTANVGGFANGASGTAFVSAGGANPASKTTSSDEHTHDVADTGTGGDNRQATLYLNYIIKT